MGWVYVLLIAVMVYVNTFWIVYEWLTLYCDRKKMREEQARQELEDEAARRKLPAVVFYESPLQKKYIEPELEPIEEMDEEYSKSDR